MSIIALFIKRTCPGYAGFEYQGANQAPDEALRRRTALISGAHQREVRVVVAPRRK